MTYDGNRLITQEGPTGITLTYSYDTAGDVTAIADSSGATTSMTYNAANEVTSKTYSDGTNTLRVDYTWDQAGDVLTETRYSDLAGTTEVGITNYGYDGSEVTSIAAYTVSSGVATLVSDYTYGYDADGRLTTLNDGGTVTNDSYDAANELTASGSQTYTYDLAGNRTGSGIVIGPNNQLQSDGTYDYTYDAAGNLITQEAIATGNTWTYGYNANNQMITAVETNGGTTLESVNYTYDVFGNRLSESVTEGGTTTTQDFVYTADGTLYATVESSAIQTRYVADVQGADHWEAQVSSTSGVEWLLSDYQGSVRQVRTLTGTLVDSITYDAFGNATDTASGTSLVGFQGMVFDIAIGQNVTTAREYDPESGRWNRVDPIGFASGQSNLYDFAGNGPTDGTDPTGLEEYLFGDPQGGKMEANRNLKNADVWEQFYLWFENGQCALRFHTGWLCAIDGGGKGVVANRPVLRLGNMDDDEGWRSCTLP